MQLTIIAGDGISSLEVGADIEIEILVSLCKIELVSIADIPLEQLQLTFNGQKIVLNSSDLLKKQLKDFNIKDGDAIHVEKIKQTAKKTIPPINVPTVISQHPLGQYPTMIAKRIYEFPEPIKVFFMRATFPEIVANKTNQTDKEAFVTAFYQSKKELARKERLMMDETSEEGQRYVAELIERQNIDFMHNFAMEHMPEAFIPVHMLYIRMKINNCPVIAFIDSGAQTSILSESCAKRCNVLRMVDKQIRVQAENRYSFIILSEGLKDLLRNVGFNIEIKYPHFLANGNNGGGYIERNKFISIVLPKIKSVVDCNRHIFFTCFDVDIHKK
uniref:Ubiquitin-like domain-containing protein n=1 Tax=Meloidogyne hapla TaxID=6305 RepID=A0A1I8BMT4_MELHA